MIPCFLAVAFSAAEPFVPSFADIPSEEAARVHLHAVGVETFVTEAQKASISPPRIHSKYWVNTMPATAFSKRWRNAFDEKSQAQSFLKEFFAVFGVDAVTAATFEHRVKFADGSQGYADCLWPGRILVEMKSRGKDLDAAFQQAMEYVRSLAAKNAEDAVRIPAHQPLQPFNPSTFNCPPL